MLGITWLFAGMGGCAWWITALTCWRIVVATGTAEMETLRSQHAALQQKVKSLAATTSTSTAEVEALRSQNAALQQENREQNQQISDVEAGTRDRITY